jgi:hypothetical protein
MLLSGCQFTRLPNAINTEIPPVKYILILPLNTEREIALSRLNKWYETCVPDVPNASSEEENKCAYGLYVQEAIKGIMQIASMNTHAYEFFVSIP